TLCAASATEARGLSDSVWPRAAAVAVLGRTSQVDGVPPHGVFLVVAAFDSKYLLVASRPADERPLLEGPHMQKVRLAALADRQLRRYRSVGQPADANRS